MKKLIAVFMFAFAILSFAGCEYSKVESDCCRQTESQPEDDCCESTADTPSYESDIPDCCGE